VARVVALISVADLAAQVPEDPCQAGAWRNPFNHDLTSRPMANCGSTALPIPPWPTNFFEGIHMALIPIAAGGRNPKG